MTRSLKKLLLEVNKGARSYVKGKVPIYPSFEAVRRCQIKKVKAFDKQKRVGYTFQIYDYGGSNTIHHVFLYQPRNDKEKFPLVSSPQPMVTCDCSHYVYTCEGALHKHGYAELLRANDEEAPVTNPNAKLVACKHVIRAIQYAINKNL